MLDAAAAVANERGAAAVTMRAVAERLNVTPMALYRHVGDKRGLIDGLVERLMLDLPLPPPDLPWQRRLAALATGLRAVALRHADLFPLLFTRPAITPAAQGPRTCVYEALRDAGVAEDEVPRVERLLSTFLLGFAASEAGGRFAGGDPDADFAYAANAMAALITGLRP